mgnify:CR=1 FL=1
MGQRWANLENLLKMNKEWVQEKLNVDADFFNHLKDIQRPEYLWIGCSDSRVPANEIVGLEPGEMFVHRNIANVVIQSDLNCLSVIQYAVEVLKIKHIIVTGHYGCGGVKVAMEHKRMGMIDNWLRSIKDVYCAHEEEVNAIPDEEGRFRRMCELNVKAQVRNVCHTSVVQDAWLRKQELCIHGWIFDVGDGILHDLGVSVHDRNQVHPIYQSE